MSRQGLVLSHDEDRFPYLLYDRGDSESLAGSALAEKDVVPEFATDDAYKLTESFRLTACGLEECVKFEVHEGSGRR